jgi:hypothetical protein
MNEQERAYRLSADVDHLLQGEALSNSEGDDGALLDVVKDLAQADFSADSAIRETLRDQLLDRAAGQQGAKPVNRKKMRWSRALTIAAAILIILTIATLTIPPLRTLAQDILGRIGAIIFTNDETIAQHALEGTPGPDFATGTGPTEYIPPTGMPPYLPSYVPDDYVVNLDATTDSSASYTKFEVGTDEYQNPINYFLDIQQDSAHVSSTSDLPIPFAIGDAKVVDVSVHGQHGVWIEQAPISVQSDSNVGMKPWNVNMLIWQENNLVFTITNKVLAPAADPPLLPLDEMLKVAESLTPTK